MKRLLLRALPALCFLVWSLNPGTVFATTVDDVIAQVNSAYSSGKITDTAVKDSLVAILNDAKTSTDSEIYQSTVDSFRTMVTSFSGSLIEATAASTILQMANGL